MKKLLPLFSFFFVSTISYSQLLRSEVYDFSVGDYYGIRHVSNNAGQFNDVNWKMQMFHILEKQVSVGGDTVVYSAQRQTYFPPINGSNPSLQIDTFQFSHVNLTATYSPTDTDLTFGNALERFWYNDTTSCYSQLVSTSSSAFCPSVINQVFDYGMQINVVDSCNSIEPFVSDYEVFSHAGGPYGGKSNPGEPTYVKNLIYLDYVNHDGVECGGFPSYFLNVDHEDLLKLSVSPNPCADNLSVNGIEAIKSFTIVTSEGRMVDGVTLDSLTNLDVSKLTSGIYFLRLTNNRDKSGIVRFVKK